VEVKELKIQIVIGECASGIEAGVPRKIHNLHAPFHGGTEGPADVLAQPAGINFIIKHGSIHKLPPFSLPERLFPTEGYR
jgi:hypothetical protein